VSEWEGASEHSGRVTVQSGSQAVTQSGSQAVDGARCTVAVVAG